jgi:hypothetical protein
MDLRSTREGVLGDVVIHKLLVGAEGFKHRPRDVVLRAGGVQVRHPHPTAEPVGPLVDHYDPRDVDDFQDATHFEGEQLDLLDQVM